MSINIKVYYVQETRFTKGILPVSAGCTAAAETVQTVFLTYQNLRVNCALSRAMATVETAKKDKRKGKTSENAWIAWSSNEGCFRIFLVFHVMIFPLACSVAFV